MILCVFFIISIAEKLFFSAPDHIRASYDYDVVKQRSELTNKPGVMEDPIVVVNMLMNIVNDVEPGKYSFNHYPGKAANVLR